MNFFVIIAMVITFQAAVASTSDEPVHSVVRGEKGQPHLVKFHSGEVLFLEQGEEKKLAHYEGKSSPKKTHELSKSMDAEPVFEPTIVSDDDIPALFNRMNPFMRRKSECSDRAHVWAWDEYQGSGIRSEKVFLFLTDTYIRRHRFKWWFHVAPLYTTTSGQKIVMDFQFFDGPVTFTHWKNQLVFTKRECVTEFRFLDYNAGADQSQDCYTKFEPMYYRLPGDIGARETGAYKTDWNKSEVSGARTRAFYKGSI